MWARWVAILSVDLVRAHLLTTYLPPRFYPGILHPALAQHGLGRASGPRVHLPAHGQRRRAARIFSGRVASAVHHRLPRDRVPALPAMSPLYLHRQRDLARSAWKATDGMCHCASLGANGGVARSVGSKSLWSCGPALVSIQTRQRVLGDGNCYGFLPGPTPDR